MHHRTIKMKPIDVRSEAYIEYNIDHNIKDPEFKVGDQAKILKYKNVLSRKGVTNQFGLNKFL